MRLVPWQPLLLRTVYLNSGLSPTLKLIVAILLTVAFLAQMAGVILIVLDIRDDIRMARKVAEVPSRPPVSLQNRFGGARRGAYGIPAQRSLPPDTRRRRRGFSESLSKVGLQGVSLAVFLGWDSCSQESYWDSLAASSPWWGSALAQNCNVF